MNAYLTYENGINYVVISSTDGNSWTCRVEGQISLSQYYGKGDSKLRIYYSSPNNISGTIYILMNGECLSQTKTLIFQTQDFDSDAWKTSGFSVADTYIELNSSKISQSSASTVVSTQYGITISGNDSKIDIYLTDKSNKTNIVPAGMYNVIFQGNGTETDETLIFTENTTNAKKYLRITEYTVPYVKFLYIEDGLGNKPSNNTIEWSGGDMYFRVVSSSFISSFKTNVSSTNFNIDLIGDENLYRVTPLISGKINETITFSNNDNLSASIVLSVTG